MTVVAYGVDHGVERVLTMVPIRPKNRIKADVTRSFSSGYLFQKVIFHRPYP